MKLRDLKNNAEVQEYYKKGNEILGKLGYTDHSVGHAEIVARQAANILDQFGYSDHEIELVKIAGYLHDIGNAINRSHHAEYGALLANEILFDPVSAALIIADKTDVRRNRVRTKDPVQFDIHDRVNYAVVGQNLQCDVDRKSITLNLQIDEHICTMYDYFEIFLGRMVMCRRAAEVLGVTFKLKANGQKVL